MSVVLNLSVSLCIVLNVRLIVVMFVVMLDSIGSKFNVIV